MTESTLSMTYTELLAEVGDLLRIDRDYSSWSANDRLLVDSCIKRGLRRFYNPPLLPGQSVVHEWSFLHILATLTTVANDSDYDLPADFGGVEGGFTYDPSNPYPPIRTVGEGEVRERLACGVSTGRPQLAAIRPKSSDGTSGQIQEVIFWPIVDGIYTLSYRYSVICNQLSETKPYPLGGMQHSQTILEACLAEAEGSDDQTGFHENQFLKQLTASIATDQRQSPGIIRGRSQGNSVRVGNLVTYNGVLYDANS